ncbi:hypothetical protein D3C80_1823180 [compost metagenome]
MNFLLTGQTYHLYQFGTGAPVRIGHIHPERHAHHIVLIMSAAQTDDGQVAIQAYRFSAQLNSRC